MYTVHTHINIYIYTCINIYLCAYTNMYVCIYVYTFFHNFEIMCRC